MDQTESTIAAWAFLLFSVSIALEWGIWRQRGARKFILKDSLVNLSLVVMQMILDVLGKTLFVVYGLGWVQAHGLKLVPETWWAAVILFLGVDLAYYWFHRASHRSRILWAIHVTHHSSALINFTTALRQPPLEHLVDWLWFLPLAWIGFSPKLILLMYGFNLIYQFFIHTELIEKLPRWIEAILNTPSHHRVHHGTNPEYIDMNYAGVLIVWDRLFRTFIAEKALVTYGLIHPITSTNPFYVGFHLWKEIVRDLRQPSSWRSKFKMIFAPPGTLQVFAQDLALNRVENQTQHEQ